jgi:chromosome segregation ATPase
MAQHHTASDAAPEVRLELPAGSVRPTVYDVHGGEFLIGSVAGCDLRVPGAKLPPVLAVITRHSDGVRLRKLAPTAPVQLNGRPVHHADLHDGDTIGLGEVAIGVRVGQGAGSTSQESGFRGQRERADALDALSVGFEPVTARPPRDRAYGEVDPAAAHLAAEKEELARLRADLAGLQRDLHQRYQERRDRLAGLQQAVEHAAHKVQDRKRELDELERGLTPRLRELEARDQQLAGREADLAAGREAFEETRRVADEDCRSREARLLADEKRLSERLAECVRREEKAAEAEVRYQSDLARLDRLSGTIEHREKQLDARTTDLDRRNEQLHRDATELEEQARQLDAAHESQRQEAERLGKQKDEQEALIAQLAERAALVEGQQAMLATLRTRLERLRDEVRQEAQALTEQRARQEVSERAIQEQLRETERLRSTIDTDQRTNAQERQNFEQESQKLRVGLHRLKDLQERLAGEDMKLRQRGAALDAQAAQQSEQAGMLKARAEQLLELQQRIQADRQSLRDREAALAQTEEARKALQEQLRRRGEDLAARQKQVDEQSRACEHREAQLGDQGATVAQLRQDAESKIVAAKQALEEQTAALLQRTTALEEREKTLRGQIERLQNAGKVLAGHRKAHHETKTTWEQEQRRATAESERLRAELETFRRETAEQAAELQKQLPDLELRGQAVLERLAQAREQMQAHLAELHDYTRQSHDDLQALRSQIQSESERLRQQELALQRARADHRLAVTGFRQQLIDWQHRVTEMRQTLTHDETRLEWKQAEVEQQARQVGETSQQLARQSAELRQQERQVSQRRGQFERHLGDMREWYRKKLRELAESSAVPENSAAPEPLPFSRDASEASGAPPSAPLEDWGRGETVHDDAPPDVLALTSELDPADRQLGELLRSAELVDAETLTALLLEARRQRRSLRQVLLSGRGAGAAALSLYQLALIEAGNFHGLVLGPLRVIDRLTSSPREAVYRVFDPRRGATGVLRHLAEGEMQDAVRPDEFRQRFAAAAGLRHENLAATFEVLEINGRPAALQEWLSGLPSGEWPFLAAVPGVWCRLVTQAASGLAAAHQAGLVHGHWSPSSAILTADGTVKLTGFGEPPWLTGTADADATVAADLVAFGSIITAWSEIPPRRKNAKAPKPLPAPLRKVLARLTPDAKDGYTTAAELVEDLRQADSSLPDLGEAWERLLKYAGENATEVVAWRKSA